MGFLDKMKNKMENKVADKIVDKVFGKEKKDAEEAIIESQQAIIEEQQRQLDAQRAAQAQGATEAPAPETYEAQMAEREMAMQQAAAMNAAAARGGNVPSAEEIEKLMGMAYNTKRCPSCQAICMNAPVECPYCHADLKNVRPLTPKELEELEG